MEIFSFTENHGYAHNNLIENVTLREKNNFNLKVNYKTVNRKLTDKYESKKILEEIKQLERSVEIIER